MNVEEPQKPRRRVKVKKGGHGGHHGGAWKVAYADFVTAMMALFLVLWLVSQGDQKLKEQIANYFRSPGVFTTVQGGILGGAQKPNKNVNSKNTKGDPDSLQTAAAQLKEKFSKLSEFTPYNDQVHVEMTEEGLLIQIIDKAEAVSFESGSSVLTPSAKEILKEIAKTICQLPNPIRIGGHTDAYPFSSSQRTNWELSADRANSARRELEADCVDGKRIKEIIGYADTKPLVASDPYDPTNRRISIVVFWENTPRKGFFSSSSHSSSK